MLMLALFQMLKHDNYKLGRIIYTKYISKFQTKTGYPYFVVEDAKELLQIFSLISGAEEFSRFGSATQINEYFEQNKISSSVTMQQVLAAMDDFSEKLKICSSQENMLESIENLSKVLDSYDSKLARDNREKFFATMLPGIKDKYAIILGERKVNKKGKIYYKSKNIFSLIYWAAEKGFLQQALTYYTEWIPKYLVDKKGWLVPNNGFQKSSAEFDGNKKFNTWYDYLFTTYNQWNKQLKVTKPTQSVFFNILNTGNKPDAYSKKQYVSLSELINTVVDCKENQITLDYMKIYQTQIQELEAEFNKKAVKDVNSFQDVVIDYYGRNVIARNSESILLDVIDEFYKYKTFTYSYNNSNANDRAKLKKTLKDLYLNQKEPVNFDVLGAELLKSVLGRFVDKSLDKKTVVYFVSRRFKLYDNIDQQVLRSPDFVAPDIILDKGIPRDEMFASLLKTGDISTCGDLTDDKLIKLAGDYMKFKNEYRNRANHASFNGSKESNIVLQKEIMDSVRPLCDFSL